jgi:hypothetical protein
MKKRGLFLTTHPLQEAKAQVHSMLENELTDIRQCLARLEERLRGRIEEISASQGQDIQAA